MSKKLFFLGVVLTGFLTSSISILAQEVVWKKHFGGSGTDEYNSIIAVSDGIVVAGVSDVFGTGDWTGVTGKGSEDAIIVKYDNNGNVVWKKNFGGSGQDVYRAITAVSDGIVAVGFSYYSFGSGDWAGTTGKGSSDAIIVKYDNNGDVVWKKNFGGNGMDDYSSVITVSDGIIAVGYSNFGSFENGDWAGVTGKGQADAIIVKYDNNGNVIWEKSLGGSDEDFYLSATTVSDGIIVAGYSFSGSFGNGDWAGVIGKGDMDAIVVKYDNNGNVVWKKNFGGSGNNYYLSITTVSDGVVAAGGSDVFGVGDWAGTTGKGETDAIIVKYDNNGNVIWKKNFGDGGQDNYNSLAAVSDGILAVGSSDTFGSGDWAGVIGKGDMDAIVVKYDNNGNVVWKKNFGGSGDDNYFSVAIVSNDIIALGYSEEDSFGDGDWTGVTGKGDDDAIIVKYNTNGVDIVERIQETGIRVYPNPTTSQLIIDNTQVMIKDITIVDMMGRIINADTRVCSDTNEIIMDISHLPAGVYFLRIGNQTTKVMKQ